jgi:hypothetical protein
MMVVIRWSCTLFKIDRQMRRIKDLKEEPSPQVDAGFIRQPAYREVGCMGSGACT